MFIKKTFSIGLFIFLGIPLFLILNLRPVDSSATAPVKFIVERGVGFREITQQLSNQGLIRSLISFRVYSILTGSINKFKPGHYQISPSLSAVKINQLLVSGAPLVTIVVKEGETLKDIDFELSQAGVIKTGELENFDWRNLVSEYFFLKGVKSLEGFIFPDTYKFSPYMPIDTVVKKFLNNFELNVRSIPFAFNYKTLIIASLIEKEAPFVQDQKIISGIIYKRLKLGMPLQIDASVVYSKCQEKFVTCGDRERVISKDDLNLESPHNTYRFSGLPPTPISNPGRSALLAAFQPIDSKYFYYISDPITKRTIFSQTLDEHNRNRVKYLHLR